MTDLDKMARELLTVELDKQGQRDSAADVYANRLNDVTRAAVSAIRSALLTAPPGYALVDRATLLEMRDVAIRWTRAGRLPECGAFSHIARDAHAMLAAAPEVK